LNGEFMFEDTVAYAGKYELPETDFELMWSGVGQYKDIMTPLHLCLLTAAIANDGVMMEPKLLLEVRDASGNAVKSLAPKEYKKLLSIEEAAFLQEAMRDVVSFGTGTYASVSGFTICGKTGTADVASDPSIKPHAWFTGFVENDKYPYAICNPGKCG